MGRDEVGRGGERGRRGGRREEGSKDTRGGAGGRGDVRDKDRKLRASPGNGNNPKSSDRLTGENIGWHTDG